MRQVTLNNEMAYIIEYLRCRREEDFIIKSPRFVRLTKEAILKMVPVPDFKPLTDDIRALFMLARTKEFIIEGYLPTADDFVWFYRFAKYLYHALGGRFYGSDIGLLEVLLMMKIMTIDQETDSDARPLFVSKNVGTNLHRFNNADYKRLELKINQSLHKITSVIKRTYKTGGLNEENICNLQPDFQCEWGLIWSLFAKVPFYFNDLPHYSKKERQIIDEFFIEYGYLLKIIDDLVDIHENVDDEVWNLVIIIIGQYLFKSKTIPKEEKIKPSFVLKMTYRNDVQEFFTKKVEELIRSVFDKMDKVQSLVVDKKSWELCKNMLLIPIHAQLSHLE